MSIVRWRPFSDLMSLSETMDRLFEDRFVSPDHWVTWRASEVVPVDMFETENEILINAALPGVSPEDVEITLLGDTVTIKGETKIDNELKEGDCLCRETRYGSFHRELTLPVRVSSEKAEAKFENGMLRLTLPKAEETKPKQIKVSVHPKIEAKSKSLKDGKK